VREINNPQGVVVLSFLIASPSMALGSFNMSNELNEVVEKLGYSKKTS